MTAVNFVSNFSEAVILSCFPSIHIYHQNYWFIHLFHPFDWAPDAFEHNQSVLDHHVPRTAGCGWVSAVVPGYLPGERDERVPHGGGPVCQTDLPVPQPRDNYKIHTADCTHW